MRLRFLEIARAPCARTVEGSSTVVIGGHEWREVEEQEAAQDLPADGRAARRRERGGARPLRQACEVAICCWTGLCRKARCTCAAARAASDLPTGRAELVF